MKESEGTSNSSINKEYNAKFSENYEDFRILLSKSATRLRLSPSTFEELRSFVEIFHDSFKKEFFSDRLTNYLM
jgi:hypothetical protein